MRALVNGGTLTITPKKLGTTKIRVQEGNGKKTTEITIIVKAVPITLCKIADIPAQTYTGSAFTPDLTVTYGNITLTKGTDYTVTYSNNTNAGTAAATVTGVGNYAGTTETISKNFTINKATGSGTVSMAGWIAGNTASNPVTSTSTNGTPTITYKVQGAADSTYTATKPTTAGNYTVRAVFATTTNYYEYTTTANFTIQAALYSINSGSPTYHTTLSSAVNSCNAGGTITVLGNTSNEGALTINKNLTINLQSYTLTRTGTLTVSAGTTTVTGTGGINCTADTNGISITGTGIFKTSKTPLLKSVGRVIDGTNSATVTLEGGYVWSTTRFCIQMDTASKLTVTNSYVYTPHLNKTAINFESGSTGTCTINGSSRIGSGSANTNGDSNTSGAYPAIWHGSSGKISVGGEARVLCRSVW